MAIIANRAKNNNRVTEFSKFILFILKRSFILFLIILSLCIFITTPKKFSSISLEIIGNCVSAGLVVYEYTFKQINFITQKLTYLQNLELENTELKLEIMRLKLLENDIISLQNENIELKSLLHVIDEKQYSYITVKLLAISLNPFSKTALVTAGTRHGIKLNQIVTNSHGLIGRIIEISNNYSRIMLTNDINSRIPVITSLSQEKGILTADGNDNKIIYLEENHSIQKGEKVITSGYGNIYPPGITVGYITKVRTKDAIVKPIINLSNTKFVNILLPN